MPVLQWYKFMFPREMCAPEHINHYHGIAWLPYCCTVISMARYHFCCCHFCPQQHHQLQCTRDSIICVYIKSWIVENPQACILYYLWLNLNLHFQNYFCSILILLLGSHLRSQLHHSVVYLHHSRQAATYLYVYALIILVLWYVHFAYLYHLVFTSSICVYLSILRIIIMYACIFVPLKFVLWYARWSSP